MRLCKECKTFKELREFPHHFTCREGRGHTCNECNRMRARRPRCSVCNSLVKTHGCPTCLLNSGLKKCSGCQLVKTTDKFAVDRSNRTGLRPQCKECNGAYRAQSTKKYPRTYRQLQLAKKRHATKYKEDINFRLSVRLRNRLRDALKGRSKSGSGIRNLGCTIEQGRRHLESQFEPGWTWDDWGTKFEIDHIQPLCSFDLTKHDQFKKACHYSNLQPLSIEKHKLKSIKDCLKNKTADSVPAKSALDHTECIDSHSELSHKNPYSS